MHPIINTLNQVFSSEQIELVFKEVFKKVKQLKSKISGFLRRSLVIERLLTLISILFSLEIIFILPAAASVFPGENLPPSDQVSKSPLRESVPQSSTTDTTLRESLEEKKGGKVPKTMKAAVLHEFGQSLSIETIPIPDLQPGEILVKIMASGVCHTDLHAINGDWPVKPTLPLIPGHEGVGVVAAVGAAVTSAKVGDRVGVPWLYTACGRCEHCLSGWETVCASQKNTGYSVNGCYAEYVVADPNYVAHLPERLDYAPAASILCAGVTVYKGIKETDAKPGDWIVISGIGGLGHMAVQYAKAMGLHVVAVDIYSEKLELAKRLGADIAINAAEEDAVARLWKEIQGAHGALVTAVSTHSFTQAVNMLRPRGTAALIGLPPGDFKLSIFDMVLHRKTVRGSIVGTRMDLIEALQFAAEGKVAVNYTVDRLENINQIFTKMKAGQIQGRVVMMM